MIPSVPTRTKDITVAGVKFTIRCLSRAEANHVQIGFHAPDLTDLPDVEAKSAACEVYILAKGLSVPEEEATAWRDSTDGNVVGEVIEAITVLAGITEGGPDPQAPTRRPSRKAVSTPSTGP